MRRTILCSIGMLGLVGLVLGAWLLVATPTDLLSLAPIGKIAAHPVVAGIASTVPPDVAPTPQDTPYRDMPRDVGAQPVTPASDLLPAPPAPTDQGVTDEFAAPATASAGEGTVTPAVGLDYADAASPPSAAPQQVGAAPSLASPVTSAGTSPGQEPAAPRPRAAVVPTRRIALTFDDGYNSANVNRLLDILEREQVHATFFPVGMWVRQDPTTFKRIAAHFEVGNHTYSHTHLTRLSDAMVRQEVLAGVPGHILRPPYGDVDARVRGIVQSLGYRVVLWDIDSRDWAGASPTQETVNVVSHAHDGGIVLMHMGDSNTVAAIPQTIAQLRTLGYTFVTVSELPAGGASPQART